MKHYLILKLKKDVDANKACKVIEPYFETMKKTIKGYNDYKININTIDNPSKYDLMVIMDMESLDTLNEYQPSLIHQDLKKVLPDISESKVIFDEI